MDPEWLAQQFTLCYSSPDTEVRKSAWDQTAQALWPVCRKMAIMEQRGSWFASRSWDMAEDAAMFALAALIERVQKGATPDSPLAWLRVVIRNNLRRNSVKGFYARELPTDEDWQFDVPQHDQSPSLSVVGRLRQLVAFLPDDDRHLIHLRYWDEVSVEEIAIIFDLNPGTIRYRLRRIHSWFRRELLSSGYDGTAWAGTSFG